ncbi:MAG: hypothetical protein WC777_03470 [Candidatus Gracilibacteria bacterium]|jgi:hypothetical protein
MTDLKDIYGGFQDIGELEWKRAKLEEGQSTERRHLHQKHEAELLRLRVQHKVEEEELAASQKIQADSEPAFSAKVERALKLKAQMHQALMQILDETRSTDHYYAIDLADRLISGMDLQAEPPLINLDSGTLSLQEAEDIIRGVAKEIGLTREAVLAAFKSKRLDDARIEEIRTEISQHRRVGAKALIKA